MTTATNIKPGVRMTLEEFFELPETVIPRYELHWGELYIVAEPSLDHQHLTKLLIRHLCEQIEDTGAGYVLPPVDIVLSDDTIVAPDIVVIRTERGRHYAPAAYLRPAGHRGRSVIHESQG